MSNTKKIVFIGILLFASCDWYSLDAERQYEKQVVEYCRKVSSGPVVEVENYAKLDIPYMEDCPDLYDGITCPSDQEYNDKFFVLVKASERGWRLESIPVKGAVTCCGRFEKECTPVPICQYFFTFGAVPKNAIIPDCRETQPTYRCWVNLDSRDWMMYPSDRQIPRFEALNLDKEECVESL